MRYSTIDTLALTAVALSTTNTSAAGFVGSYAVAGSGRTMRAMNQTTSIVLILAMPIKAAIVRRISWHAHQHFVHFADGLDCDAARGDAVDESCAGS